MRMNLAGIGRGGAREGGNILGGGGGLGGGLIHPVTLSASWLGSDGGAPRSLEQRTGEKEEAVVGWALDTVHLGQCTVAFFYFLFTEKMLCII